jgi:hypothetical protein
MGGFDSVKITGEMEIDIYRRLDRGHTATGPAALVTEHRSERWLPDG